MLDWLALWLTRERERDGRPVTWSAGTTRQVILVLSGQRPDGPRASAEPGQPLRQAAGHPAQRQHRQTGPVCKPCPSNRPQAGGTHMACRGKRR